jgi:Uma2 family endonuclease
MPTAWVPTPPLSAEQFAERPDPGYPEELVRRRIVTTPQPKPRRGEICNKAGRILGNYAEERDLGRVLSNDSGVIPERSPDTVRGADISFYSFARVPTGPLPDHYLDTPPDLVVEVLSPGDRWPNELRKVAEYVDAGVTKGVSA